MFVFRDFNVHHKDWLTYSAGNDRAGELIFYITNNLTQKVKFPIPDSDSHSLALLDLFISSDATISSTMAFPPFRNSNHVVVLVSIDFPINSQNRMSCFMVWLMSILVLIGMVFVTIWDMIRGTISSNSVLLMLPVNFMSWFSLELMYISLISKYQVKPHSSPWFSSACDAAIVHREHFFRFVPTE